MITKTEARARVKDFRKALLAEEADEMSYRICKKLIEMNVYKNCSNLYIYKSVNNEVDTDAVIKNALAAGKTVAFPKVDGENIVFYNISDASELEFGYMGIPEPSGDVTKLADADKGVIIVPGVAFDRNCNRSGYGRGFYDRFLTSHPGLTKIGVAFDLQVFDELETDSFDIPLDIIITESSTIDCRKDN